MTTTARIAWEPDATADPTATLSAQIVPPKLLFSMLQPA
jgi:hypothetical protein